MTDVHAETLDQLRKRTSDKWVKYPQDVLPLFVAEMDYPLAPVVRDAIIERVAASDTGYVSSSLPVATAFAGFAARRWNWEVDPENVLSTTDVSVAVVESLRGVIAAGDGVVVCSPVYAPFFAYPVEAGGVVVDVPLRHDDGVWSLDLDAIEEAFAAGARAFILCNPHNPVGLVHSRQSLEALADLAARFGVTVISDEIHAPLTHTDATFIPFLSVSEAAREHGITATSASKAFNLAGVKCALIVAASDRGRSVLDRMPDEVRWRTSLLGMHGSIAAFEHGDDWLDGTIAALEANREMLGHLLAIQLPDVGYEPPSATYLAWLDLSALEWGDDPSIRALEAKVALSPGPTFGPQGVGFARLNFACSPEVLIEAIGRLAAAR